MPGLVIIFSVLLWLFIAVKVLGSGYDTYLGESKVATISPVMSEIIDGVARPVHGIRDNGPCGETRPCVGTLTPETIPAVPLPAPWLFLAGALAALAMMRKRRR